MASSQPPLPEGTDSILDGAMNADVAASTPYDTPVGGGATSATGDAGAAASAKLGDAAAKVGEATAGLRAQAADKAREYALQGKDRAVGALDNVSKLVDEAAATVDEKVGEQYGAYVRRASDAVASLTDTLREKDVDELLADARDLVRKSPAIAIGAAAAIGFAIARVIKAGVPEEPATPAAPAAPTPAPIRTPSTATTVPADSSF